VPCTVYEASGRIGGRMYSNHAFWGDGQTSEWCGEFIDSVDVTMRSLAARFGLTLADVNAAQPNASQDTNYFLGGYYTSPNWRTMRGISPRFWLRRTRPIGTLATYNHYTRPDTSSTNLSAYDWIENYVPGGTVRGWANTSMSRS